MSGPAAAVISPVTATGYVAALNPTGTALVFSTFFGGSATDLITSMVLDPVNATIDLGGAATSSDLPGIEGAYRQCVPQEFLARLSSDGAAVEETVLTPYAFGVYGVAATPKNRTFGLGGGYVELFDFQAADPAISCVANSTDLSVSTRVAPGQLLTLFGNQLAATAQSVAPVNGSYPTQAGGVQVTIGGVAAPLLYVSPGQINLQVPFEAAPDSSVTLQLTATNAEGFAVSDSRTLTVTYFQPTALQIPVAGDDTCLGNYPGQTKTLVLNADGSLNSCSNPATAGSTVTFFVDGLGGTGVTGMLNVANSGALTAPIQLSIGDAATPAVGSAAPFVGAISGFYRAQFQLPSALPASPLRASLTVNDYPSADVISIAVRQ